MKPAEFDYLRPSTLDEALHALADNADAKILAGGQSLVPLLNFRMLRPALLIDINRIAELQFLRRDEAGSLHIGALTRHFTLETSALVKEYFPVLSEAMSHVAHLAIRNRGTIGGSLSHADPAAELPMIMVLLDARLHSRNATRTRMDVAEEFFLGPLTSALASDEILTEIELPAMPAGAGWAFEEFSQRSGDFAIAAVGVTLTLRGDLIDHIRVAAMGVGSTPLRLRAAEQGLAGKVPTDEIVAAAAKAAYEAVEPDTDLKASADYRRHLVRVLTERCLKAARERAAARPKGPVLQ